MKLLIIADIYPSEENPISGIFIKEQVEQLRKYHDIRVMVIGRRFVRIGVRTFLRYILGRLLDWMKARKIADKSARKDRRNEQDIIRIEYPVFTFFKFPIHFLNGICIYLTVLMAFKKMSFRPDLIYAHKSFPSGCAGWRLKRRFNIPVVTMEFQGPFSSYFNEPYTKKRVINTINNIDRTIHCEFQIEEIRSHGVKSDKLGIAYYGVNMNRFFFDNESHQLRKQEMNKGNFKLLVIGRIEEAKGIRYLIGAIEILRQEFPGINLTIVGPIDNEGENILNLINTMDLCDNIHYQGICTNKELPLLIHKHDILISASLYETFGITLIEAMACGKPVVATRCGGPEETVNDKVGVLVEKADSQALADGIKYVIANYERYNPEEIRSYAVNNFSHEVAIERIEKIFYEVLEGK